jgi:hypothetical protein
MLFEKTREGHAPLTGVHAALLDLGQEFSNDLTEQFQVQAVVSGLLRIIAMMPRMQLADE